MRIRRRNNEDADVSMAPLIDCVFLLLIFFLVATMLKQEDKDIDITPPASRSARRLLPDSDTLVLGVDAEGNLYWEGQSTTIHQVLMRLAPVTVDNPNQRIRLDADKDAPFDRVAELLNACQFRRLNNIGIRTYDDAYNRR